MLNSSASYWISQRCLVRDHTLSTRAALFSFEGSGLKVSVEHQTSFKFQVSSFICHIHDYTETV